MRQKGARSQCFKSESDPTQAWGLAEQAEGKEVGTGSRLDTRQGSLEHEDRVLSWLPPTGWGGKRCQESYPRSEQQLWAQGGRVKVWRRLQGAGCREASDWGRELEQRAAEVRRSQSSTEGPGSRIPGGSSL